MGLTTVQVTASDGTVYNIVGDAVGTTFYPIYKLSAEAAGTGGLVSISNPLPIKLSDGTDILDVVGDGDVVDLEAKGVGVLQKASHS